MTVNQKLHVLSAGELHHRDRPETCAAVSWLVCAARVRRASSEPAPPIGVQQMAKGPYGCGMPNHRPQPAILPVLDLAQAVAVLDTRPPSGEVSCPLADLVVDADVPAQHLAAPTVVITRNPQHG